MECRTFWLGLQPGSHLAACVSTNSNVAGRCAATCVFSQSHKQQYFYGETAMKSGRVAGAIIAFAIGIGVTSVSAAEIRLAEQFSMGYLQFNVMKRDRLIEKYAGQRGLKDFKVSWQRFNGPAAMNEALLSGSTDIVAGGGSVVVTVWGQEHGPPFG